MIVIQTPSIHPDKVAIYVRWSTDEQSDGTTAEVQLEACQSFIKSQGWRPNPKLTFIDDGYSGGTLDRPAMTELRKLCTQAAVDCVVVFKLDRLSRSVLDTVNLLLKEWADKVYLKSAREPIDTTTAMGKQFFYMLISYAEWERNVIRERTMSGRLKRAQEGRHLTRPPFGYALGELHGERVIVPEEADLVQQIFQRYLGGMGDRQIATWLNSQGLRTRQGNTWHPNCVRHMLTNALYAGVVRFGHKAPGSQPGTGNSRPKVADPFLVESESKAPAIVSKEVFEGALAIRAGQAKKVSGRAAASPHLLTGLLRCKCGSSIQFKQINNKAREKGGLRFGYYMCCDKFAKGRHGCESGFLPAEKVDEVVVERFLAKFGNPSRRVAMLDEMLDARTASDTVAIRQRQSALRQEIDRLEKGLVRLDADYLSGDLPAKRYDALHGQTEEALDAAKAESRSLEAAAERHVVHEEQRRSLLVQLKQVDHWESLTVQERKQLLSIFMESIVAWRPLRSQHWDCEIHWRSDPANLDLEHRSQ
ncbi:MAG TPA: recombinase family protein [Symbiobacteriaceae bacterium]